MVFVSQQRNEGYERSFAFKIRYFFIINMLNVNNLKPFNELNSGLGEEDNEIPPQNSD